MNSKLFSLLFCLNVIAMVVIASQLITQYTLWGGSVYVELLFDKCQDLKKVV